ncbi:tripartite tricarboxylate transporter TctB family protein [Nocardioides sp. zg-1228]|uniref:tripartite tricarboxylate transporter TctB family protein n=1 Tax=Nocardioides sp. zg-1228 TaxID=2763008 RepID=UPI00164347ED|nr:tripartite tricarboxylate transporter TctB family protein [Nocardioides sp. zg-1228]MBC2932941.1 tripartite tricarboxylate transporter TctB family protein [Nocardioides sp. zg-1228]QSF56856.1 tripartite tricarboxylate transporter TctB family protein [Nocardioides sp. zg-1228]
MSTVPAAPGDSAGRSGAERSGPSFPDLMAGGTFVVLGLAFAIGGSRYDIGSALRMGSGYVPLVLGTILALLGAVIVVASFRGVDPTVANADRGDIPWRRMGLLLAAVMFFGFTVKGLGLGPSLLVTTFLAALAGHGTRPYRATIIATGLTVVCLIVFVALLQLRLSVIGDWLGG